MAVSSTAMILYLAVCLSPPLTFCFASDVVAHEIAHSWTGNLVTNATWDHFWLNEGCKFLRPPQASHPPTSSSPSPTLP
jgi:hypothetical protein